MNNRDTSMMRVTRAEYIASAVKPSQYPSGGLREFVFMGRSNVGKSSLINNLVQVRNLARVSGQPGKTQTINFFKIGAKADGQEERLEFVLADLPGYGYAKTSKANRERWAAFIREYLLKRREIQFVSQLVDIRHDPMKSDIEVFQWLVNNGIPVLVIATKSDKLSKSAANKQIERDKMLFGAPDMDILPYSSTKNEGRSELLDVIAQSLII